MRSCGWGRFVQLALALTGAALVYFATTAQAALTPRDLQRMFPAFPGAEGAGAYTPGGRGGKVLIVTTLADYDPARERPIVGSLRWAVTRKGPRIVVFRVGGNVSLKRDLYVSEPYLTIAGQSAPGGGICLKDSSLNLDTHDVIIRHLRIRPGDTQKRELDAISCSSHNVILDHCSTSWAIDEVLSTNGDSARVTVQWCLISESLNRSFHHKGTHGYGSLISGPGEISYHHCVYAFHRSRNPRPGDVLLDFRNNLVYGWLDRAGYCGNERLRMNYIGNVLHPLSYTKSPGYAFMPGGLNPHLYLSDNRMDGSPERTADNWRMVRPPRGVTSAQMQAQMRKPQAFPTSEVTTDPPSVAYQRILEQVGATLPKRDAVDRRVLDQIQHSDGKIINSQTDVGGWPDLEAGSSPADSDKDGMPDEWELAHGLDSTRAAAPGQDSDGDGYTDIEEFLNNTDPRHPQEWIDPPSIQSANGRDDADSDLHPFVGKTQVTLATATPETEIRYTLDGSSPTAQSARYGGPIELDHTATVRARAFLSGKPSHVRNVTFTRLQTQQPVVVKSPRPGLRYDYFETDDWTEFPDFSTLTATATGSVPDISLSPRKKETGFALRLTGYFEAPRDGVYHFWLRCSPRGQLLMHDAVVVESQGRRREHAGAVSLKRGFHPLVFQIYYGSDENKTLAVSCNGPGMRRQRVSASQLFH